MDHLAVKRNVLVRDLAVKRLRKVRIDDNQPALGNAKAVDVLRHLRIRLLVRLLVERARLHLDLGVHFRGAVYAVEVKTLKLYEKSPEKARQQVLRYMDRLGVSEGWLVVADSDLTKPWDGKISTAVIGQGGKTIHLIRC